MPSRTRHSASSAPASSKHVEQDSSSRNSALGGPALGSSSTSLPWSRYLLFFTLAAAGCAADLWTKHWVFDWRGFPRRDNEWWIWEPYLGIETALNRGALFGLGEGYSHVFALLSLVAIIGILAWLFAAGAARDLWLTVALGCVMGGILGNLYDRLGLWASAEVATELRSAVRDWILIRYHQYTWPNFNIADSLLVCGAGMLLWHAFVTDGATPSTEAVPSDESCRQTA